MINASGIAFLKNQNVICSTILAQCTILVQCNTFEGLHIIVPHFLSIIVSKIDRGRHSINNQEIHGLTSDTTPDDWPVLLCKIIKFIGCPANVFFYYVLFFFYLFLAKITCEFLSLLSQLNTMKPLRFLLRFH